MILEPNAIVPEALHKKVGWDMRHHFMAEKIVDRFGLALPRDRELIRQLAVIYVLGGLKAPPENTQRTNGQKRPREKGINSPGPSVPGGVLGDVGGNAPHIIKQSKGAQNRPVPRPFLLPEGPHRSGGEDQ